MHFIDSEGNSDLGEIGVRIKKRLFQSFDTILKKRECSLFRFTTIYFIEFIQALYFPFYKNLEFPWGSDGIHTEVRRITEISMIWPFISSFESVYYYVLFYAMGIVSIICVSSLLFLAFATPKKNSNFLSNISFHITKIVSSGLQTLLFLPFISIFTSIVTCKDSSHIYTNSECWVFSHFIHILFGFIFILSFLPYVMLLTACFFESHWDAPTYMSKSNSNADILHYTIKTIYCLVLIFCIDESSAWMMIVVLMASSFLFIYLYYYDMRFYSFTASKIWNSFQICFLWCNFVLSVTFLTQSISFNLGIILFLFPVPLIFFISYKMIYYPINKLNSESKVLHFIRDLAALFRDKQMEREDEIVLRGYILRCIRIDNGEEESPLLEVQKIKDDLFIKENQTILNKTINILIRHGEIVHNKLIMKYPTVYEIRLQLIRFLFFLSEEPSLSLRALNRVEFEKLSLYGQFTGYRLLLLLLERSGKKNFDVVKVMRYERLQYQLVDLLESGALLHMQLWSSLLDDHPHMRKTVAIGFKIFSQEKQMQTIWKTMQTIYPDNPKDLKIYASYHIQVANDKHYGNILLERAKDFGYLGTFNMFSAHTHDLMNISSEGTPCISLSGDKQKLGEITNCNLAASRCFGYLKKELLGLKINQLMPDMIGDVHDQFLESNADQFQISTNNNLKRTEEVTSFGLSRTRYIFPLDIKIVSTPNMLNEMQYIAKIKVDKKAMSGNIAYLLISNQGTILSISSSCVTLFSLTFEIKNNYIVSVDDMMPDLLKKRRQFMNKVGAPLNVYMPDQASITRNQKHFTDEFEKLRFSEQHNEFQCYLTELRYLNLGILGYSLKLVLNPSTLTTTYRRNKFNGRAFFQFRFDTNYNRYFMENREDENTANSIFSTGTHGFYSAEGPTTSPIALRNISKEGFQKWRKKRGIKGSRARGEPSISGISGISGYSGTSKVSRMTRNSNYSKKTMGVVFLEEGLFDIPGTPRLKKTTNNLLQPNVNKKKKLHSAYVEAFLGRIRFLKRSEGEINIIKSSNRKEDYIEEMMADEIMKMVFTKPIYDEGITTYKWDERNEGNFIEVEDKELYSPFFEKANEASEEIGSRNQKERKKIEDELGLIRTRLKTKADLKKMVKYSPMPKSLFLLKVVNLFSIILLLTVLLFEYELTKSRLNDITELANTTRYSYRILLLSLYSWFNLRELSLINNTRNFTYNIYHELYGTSHDYTNQLLNQLGDYANEMNDLNRKITSHTIDINDDHYDLFNDNSVFMLFYYAPNTLAREKYYTLSEAFSLLISSFNQISDLRENNKLVNSEAIINSAIESIIKGLFNVSLDSSTYFYEKLLDSTERENFIDYSVIGLGTLGSLICLLGAYIVIRVLRGYYYCIIDILIEVPKRITALLNQNCEDYLTEFQARELKNEEESSLAESQDGEINSQAMELRNKYMEHYRMRTFVQKSRIGRKFLWWFFTFLFVAQLYLVTFYFLSRNNYQSLFNYAENLNATHSQVIYPTYYSNLYRDYFFDKDFEITPNGQRFSEIASESWFNLYAADRLIIDTRPEECKILTDNEKSKINKLMEKNLCEFGFNPFKTAEECLKFAHGATQHGYTILFPYYMSGMRRVIFNNQGIETLNSKLLWNVTISYYKFLVPVLEEIHEIFDESLTSIVNSTLNTRIVSLGFFAFGMTLMFLILCLPFLLSIQNIIYKTKAMLSFLPIESIVLSKEFDRLIFQYFKKQLMENCSIQFQSVYLYQLVICRSPNIKPLGYVGYI